MTRKYTVLRAIRPTHTRDPFAGGGREPGPDGGQPEPRIDVLDLTSSDVRSLGRDPEVLALAPVMPTRLITPLPARTRGVDAAWGVAAVRADTSQYTGEGVTVAVLDTGIDARHEAFRGVELVQRDFTGTGNGDVNGHGTHGAGILFGRSVQGTRIGVAPGVGRALVGKVLDDDGGGESSWIFAALDWAIGGGAHIITVSLSLDFPGMVQRLMETEQWRSDLATSVALDAFRGNLRMLDAYMRLAIARAPVDGGVIVIAAAGNESLRELDARYEVSASLPAVAEGVVAVAALERVGDRFKVADFSNTFATLSGPGVDILSARRGGGLSTLSGTSMAAPHVAGVAALWWQAMCATSRTATAPRVLAKLVATCRCDAFAPHTDPADRGEGLVTAPL